MASYYNSEDIPTCSADELGVLDTLIWDDDLEHINLPTSLSFDPLYEALTLGTVEKFQEFDKFGNSSLSTATDTTVSTNPMLQVSQNQAVNLLDQISRDLEPISPIQDLHSQCSEAISKFVCDVDLYSNHLSRTTDRFDGLVSDLVDIYSAKVNVSETITFLKRIVTFLSIVTSADSYLKNKDYGTIAFMFLACNKLLESLETLNICTFEKLTAYYNNFYLSTRVSVENDINSILKGIDLTLEYRDFKTNECCLCLDLLDPEIKYTIIEKIVDKYMDKFKVCFRGSDKESTEFSRRISWFRRNLSSLVDIEAQFPPNWNFTNSFTTTFFIESSKDLETMLAKHKSPLVEEDLYNMVKMCKEFEIEQNQAQSPRRIDISITPKFDILDYPVLSTEEIKLNYNIESEKIDFSGHLTNCFEGYLGSWLYSQETSLTNSLLPFYKNETTIRKNDLNVYSSAFQLFTKFRNILNLAMSVSTEQTLLEAFQMLKRVLKLYHQLLIGQWKSGQDRDFDKLCVDGSVLVGTSLYCESMFVDMENKTCSVIRDLYQPICKKHDIIDIFLAFRSSIISKVIGEIALKVDLNAGYFDKISQFKTPVDNFIMDVVTTCDVMLDQCRNNFSNSCYEYICNKIARHILKSFNDRVSQITQNNQHFNPVIVKQISIDIILLEKYLGNLQVGENSAEPLKKHVKDEIKLILKMMSKLK